MSITTVPQELIDNIIDYFHDDVPALKACALVCWAWLPACRAHIFVRVSLRPPPLYSLPYRFLVTKPTDVQRLYRILRSSPEIAAYIHDLAICEGMIGREWLSDQTLPLLLRKLRNTQRFLFERSASMQITWSDLRADLRDAIAGVLLSPSLLELRLFGLAFDSPMQLLRILQSCQLLRVLHVKHLRLLQELPVEIPVTDNPTSQKQHRAPLDVLSIGARTSPDLISCLLHPELTIDVAAVRTLSISISGNFADFARLLREMSSLETLEIVLMNDGE